MPKTKPKEKRRSMGTTLRSFPAVRDAAAGMVFFVSFMARPQARGMTGRERKLLSRPLLLHCLNEIEPLPLIHALPQLQLCLLCRLLVMAST